MENFIIKLRLLNVSYDMYNLKCEYACRFVLHIKWLHNIKTLSIFVKNRRLVC